MAKFIEVTVKGREWFVNLDALDCISESTIDNCAILSFAGGNDETLSCDESYNGIVEKIKRGEVWTCERKIFF